MDARMSRLKNISLFIALITLSTACRFGNNIERISGQTTSAVEGYYETSPQNVTLCLEHSEGAATCGNGEARHVPPLLSQSLTNPVGFVILDATQQIGAFFNPLLTTSSVPAIQSFYDEEALQAGVSLAYSDEPFFSENCLIHDEIYLFGHFKPRAGTSPNEIRGRVELTTEVRSVLTDAVTGGCENDLQILTSCLDSSEHCPADTEADRSALQNSVQNFFAPFLETGAYDPDRARFIRDLVYEVSYE